MRVPVRRQPETRVSDGQQGYARAVTPLNLEPLTNLVEGFRDQMLDQQDARQRVELNRRLMEEVNGLQLDFEQRRRDPEISPIDFATNTNTAYTERHTALLGELRQGGYSQDLLDDFEGRLGTVRQGFFERGVTHQLAQLDSRAEEEVENIGVAASQYAAADPVHGYATARDMVRDSIRTSPDLTEDRRSALEDTQLAIVRDAGARALAIQNPQLIIDTFDPQGLTAPGRSTTGTTAINPQHLDGARTAVASVLSSGGLSPQVVAGFLGNFDVEGGYGGAQGDGGTASGIAQWREERRANFRQRFGKDPHEATPQEQAQFVLWELENPAAAGMTTEQVAAIRNADTVEKAAELIDRLYERSSGEHRSRRVEAAARYVQAASVQPVDLPPSQAAQQQEVTAPAPDVANIRTGNVLLDDLNGAERLQLLARAREQLTRVTATQRAEMDVRIGNITAEALNNGGEIAAPMPTEAEVLQVYGAVEGPQRWAQITQSQATGRAMTTFRTQSATDIQAALTALTPVPGSPTYATQLQIYQAAERAAQTLLTAREQDPAAYALQHFPAVRQAAQRSPAEYYAALDRVYESLGIDTRTAPLMTDDAARQMAQQYREMDASGRREFIRQNWSMGEDRFRRFVRGMEGTPAETDAQIFGLLRNYPRAVGSVSGIFQDILIGRDAIAQDPAKRPPADAVTRQFRTAALSAVQDLDTPTSRAIQDATEGLYVQRGGNNADGTMNINRYNESLRTVLGGNLPVSMGHGQAGQYRTILPPGTNREQFEAFIERQTLQSLSALSIGGFAPRYGDLRTAVPIQEIIDNGTFVMTSPGHYMIRMASDGRPLMNVRGQRFIVNLTRRDVVR